MAKKKKNSLREWFAQNKGTGWVDCKTGKPCGRQKGEKRRGYPACRPTHGTMHLCGKEKELRQNELVGRIKRLMVA